MCRCFNRRTRWTQAHADVGACATHPQGDTAYTRACSTMLLICWQHPMSTAHAPSPTCRPVPHRGKDHCLVRIWRQLRGRVGDQRPGRRVRQAWAPVTLRRLCCGSSNSRRGRQALGFVAADALSLVWGRTQPLPSQTLLCSRCVLQSVCGQQAVQYVGLVRPISSHRQQVCPTARQTCCTSCGYAENSCSAAANH